MASPLEVDENDNSAQLVGEQEFSGEGEQPTVKLVLKEIQPILQANILIVTPGKVRNLAFNALRVPINLFQEPEEMCNHTWLLHKDCVIEGGRLGFVHMRSSVPLLRCV
jgi:hypothetical protein